MKESITLIKHRLLILGVVLLWLNPFVAKSQSLNFIVTQNNLPYLDGKTIKTTNAVSLQLLNQNLVKGRAYKLELSIEGGGIKLRTSGELYTAPIILDGEPVKYLNSVDLAPFFDIENLDFSGYTKEAYEEFGGLPDGSYQVCFQLFDNTSDAYFATGQKACTYMWVKREDPPKITTPVRNPTIENEMPYAITWMPRHTTAAYVEYEMEVYENDGNMTYQDIILYQSPVLKIKRPNTQYLITANNNVLKTGRQYFVIVKATGNSVLFKNGGYSAPEYFTYGRAKAERSVPLPCPIPEGRVFINEISQGCFGTGKGSKEYVELVAVPQGNNTSVNIQGYIIDDNNYSAAEVGNEPGHIRLGPCFSNVPRGMIILIYNEKDLNPLIDRTKDGKPGSGGWWQLPFNDPCLIHYNGCPDQSNDSYDCAPSAIKVEWDNYIPMRNTNDVLQVRNTNFGLEHALIWVTNEYEYNNSPKTVRINNIPNADSKTFAFTSGIDWFNPANWSVHTCAGGNQSTPGKVNNKNNEGLIDKIKNGIFYNNFYISCSPNNTPPLGATVLVNLSSPGNSFEVYVDGTYVTTTTTNPYTIPNISAGNHVIRIVEVQTGCDAECIVELTCSNVGMPCNDEDECTINDVVNEYCVCAGEPLLEVQFSETGFDTLCNYCNLLVYVCDSIDMLAAIIDTITLKLPDGSIVLLDHTTPGLNFPYCYEGYLGSPSNFSGCNGLAAIFNDLPNDLNQWMATNGYVGIAKIDYEGQNCYPLRSAQNYQNCWPSLLIDSTELEFISMHVGYFSESQGGWEYSDYYESDFTEYGCGPSLVDSITAYIECEGPITYLWSNGATTATIDINPGSCYGVTVTCGDGCSYEAVYGENCECIVGGPCPGADPCYYYGNYDEECNCPEPILYPDTNGDGNCDPCTTYGQPCDDGNACTLNDSITIACICVGQPMQEITFDTNYIQGDTICDYCVDFDTCTYSYTIKNIKLKTPSGQQVTLDQNSNNLGFNFPYCINSGISNPSCFGLADQYELISDINVYLDVNQFYGLAQYNRESQCVVKLGNPPLICYNQLNILGSKATFVSINYDRKAVNSSIVSNQTWPFVKSNCTLSPTTIEVIPIIACDSIISYEWSTGETTSTLIIDSIGLCYGVTITCSDGCEYTATFGENCENCIFGNPCDDGNQCTGGDYYDANCMCVAGYQIPDSDGDTNCDPIDICPGEDDFIDFDQDSIPDCLDSIITCEHFEASLVIDTILPGTCNYSINIDSLLGSNPYINISKVLLSQGTQNFIIDDNMPICYTNGPIPPPVVVYDDNFDNNQWGNWNGYPEDAKVIKKYPNSGEYSLRLRDNSDFSWAKCNTFYVNGYSALEVKFSLYAEGFTSNVQKFALEVAYNGSNDFVVVKEWSYDNHFNNGDRVSLGHIFNINQASSAQVRLRCNYSDFGGNTNFDDARLYFDDILVKKKTNNCSNNLNVLAESIQSWIDDPANQATGIVSIVTGMTQDPCSTPGRKIYITGSNHSFDGIVFSTPSSGSQKGFCAWDCTGSLTGDTCYIVRVETNCPEPSFVWSDGSTADTLKVSSLGATMNVTVNCAENCDTMLVFGGGGCQVGANCFDPITCISGMLNEDCECEGSLVMDDFDGDGILDCFDVCFACALNDANNNGICDCDEPCPPIDSIGFIYTPITSQICNYCTSIEQGLNNKLIAAELYDSVGQVYNLSSIAGFDFPYCGDVNQYYCTINNIEYPSLRLFVSDFYQWYSQYDQEFRVFIEKDSTCQVGSRYTIKLEGTKIKELRLKFENTISESKEIECGSDTIGYNVQVDMSNLPNCSSPYFQWSNGSNEPTVFVPSNTSGFMVTITCENGYGCTYVDSTDNTNCFVGTLCDDHNNCTINDRYDENCFCIGDLVEDSDKDGVCDSIDICEGFNDYLDDDGDGLPNGCDTCLINTTLRCKYCVDLYPDPNIGCYVVFGFSYLDQNGILKEVLFPAVKYCPPNDPIGLANVIFEINKALSNNNINGKAVFTDKECSPLGISISIINTDVEFVNLYVKSKIANSFRFRKICTQNVDRRCDDGDPCTVNDMIDDQCNCRGECIDADFDNICDGDGSGKAPCDRCLDSPDYFDVNQNGIPDGCDRVTFNCRGQEYKFCEYLKEISKCESKFQPFPMLAFQDSLRLLIQNGIWIDSTFYIPALIKNLINGDDSDGDGIINFLDPCPDTFNKPDVNGLFCVSNFNNYTTDFDQCCDDSIDGIKASLLAYLFFNPGNTVLENNNEIIYFPQCAKDFELIDKDGFWYQGDCKVNINVSCECECSVEFTDDADHDGICDQLDSLFGDTCILVCPPVLDRCQVCAVVANPSYDAFDPSSGPPCSVVITDIKDTDHDGVCDLYDQCPGTAADSTATGGPLPEFDDGIDVNGNGIPKCLDFCDDVNLAAYQREGYEPPVGLGDVCDDGNPCTYADSISINCQCEGIPIDVDQDSIYDCTDCKIYQFIGGQYVEVSSYGPFDPAGVYIVTGGAPSNTATKCDLCPDLDDHNDYNSNGIPDCIDPPYYPIGCPDTIYLVPSGGLALSFDSEEIKLEDIPDPVELTFQAGSSAGFAEIFNYPYLTISNVLETDSTFEVLYTIPDLPFISSTSFVGVSYAGHQNCVNGDPTNLTDPPCPSNITILNGKIKVRIDFGNTGTPDISRLYNDFNITGSYGVNNTTINADLIASIVSEVNTGIFDLTFEIDGVHPDSNVVINNINLSNGITCPYSGGTITTPSYCPGVVPGSPCDDGDPCTHHDRIQPNGTACPCKGDPKPDVDLDGICDEIDPCPDDPNDPATGACPCPALNLTSSELVNGNDFSLELDTTNLDQLTGFTITISGGPDGDINQSSGITMPLVVANLPKGYPLTITITGNGANGCSVSVTEEIDVPFGDSYACGEEIPEANLESEARLPKLIKDDEFKASDFVIVVNSATGSDGIFSGVGYIKVPYFKQLRLNVKFKDVLINSSFILKRGYVELTGAGLKVLSDDISNVLNDVLDVLEEVSNVLEDVIDVLETIENTIKDLIPYLPPNLQQCMVDTKAAYLAAVESGNQADITTTKAAYEACMQQVKLALAELLEDFNNIINLAIAELETDYANVVPPLQSTLVTQEGLINTYLDQFQNFSTGTDVAPEENEYYSYVKSIPYGASNQVLLDKFIEYHNAGMAYFTAELLSKLNNQAPTKEERQEIIEIIDFLGKSITDHVCAMIAEGSKTEAEMVYSTKNELDKYFAVLYVYLNSKK